MLKNKTYITVILSLFLILILGLILPKQNTVKTQLERFWLKKTFSDKNYDIVIMGDSRTYRGVSPQAMQQILTNYKILNFAYSNGGLNNFMFGEAEKRSMAMSLQSPDPSLARSSGGIGRVRALPHSWPK